MMRLKTHRPWLRSMIAATAMLVAPAALLGASSCVDDVGLINRTAPDKIDKTMFEGVWLYVGTVTDAPYSSAVGFTGQMNFGDNAKVIFDIQEKFLVAYPVVETVEGTEAEWKHHAIRRYWDPDNRDQFQEMYVGPPVARWPIKSHFDINRSYNSYNGAQSNEVVENTTNRPWYERDYIRVDWAGQSISSFFFSLGATKGLTSYLVSEAHADEPDSMELDGDGGYFDYVMRVDVKATGADYCNIYGLSKYDCAPTELRLRHSFRRLDATRDYEPLRYHNNEHQEKFGYFLTERNAYDADWGPTYEGKVSWANRWNLWRDNFDYERPRDAEGAELTIACFKDADCDRDAGLRCQKASSWFDDGYCAKPVARPYAQRTLKPIVYWLSADWHDDYREGAYHAADEWSDVFKDAVAWKLFYEELGLGETRGCDTHADCVTADLLVDRDLTLRDGAIACHATSDCSSVAGAVCGAGGFCVAQRACGAGNPCAVGQSCQGGVCSVGGQPVDQIIRASGAHGSTVVYHGSGTIVTHDNFSTATLGALASQPSHAFVRFVHASPEGGALSLRVNNVTIAGGGYDAARDLDPQDPATAQWMATVPAGSALDFDIVAGGQVVGTQKADLVQGSNYLVIYNGENVIVVGASFNDSQFGVRLIHAAAGEGKLDFALEGARVDEAVSYRFATEFRNIAGDEQRVTVSRSGARGDLTCHVSDTIGRCVGWGPTITPAHKDRVAELKDGLQELFVLCDNRFDEVGAFDQANVDLGRAHLGDARYTRGDYNPCSDPDLVLGDPTAMKKIGDTRYSMYNWVNEAQRSGPLGYGPSASDPDTGEIIYAVANIYGGAVHTYSQYAADLINLVNGDLDATDVITGQHVRDFVAVRQSDPDPETASYFGGMASAEVKQARLADLHTDLTSTLPSVGAKAGGLHEHKHLRRHDYEFPELVEYQRNPGKLAADLEQRLPSVDPALFQKRLEKVKGTWVEDMMINNEIERAASWVDPDGELSIDELRNQLSPVAWASKFALKKEEERTALLAKNNIYMGEFIDDALFGLAKELKEQGLSGEALRLAIGKRIQQGVLEHEIGHTVGLRHNFSGSTDVFNFHDEYYSIRETEFIFCREDTWCDDIVGEQCAIQNCSSDGDCPAGLFCSPDDTGAFKCSAPDNFAGGDLAPTGVCAHPVENKQCSTNAQCSEEEVCGDNGSCFRPSAQFVPRSWMTDYEKANKRTQYQYTTTMDYGAKVNSDIEGLGKYDYAAIKFGYAQLVDIWEDTDKLRARVDEAARQTGNTSAYFSFYLNAANWPSRGTGFWHAFSYLNNYIGIEQNLKRIPMPYEVVKYQREMTVNDVREYLDMAHIEVPYAMCSDEYRGNMGCYYFDQGIDPGEMAGNARAQMEQYYIFDAFKRERMWFGDYGNPFAYYGRIMDRYLRVLGDVGMYFALWDSFLFRYSWYDEWKQMPLGGRSLERAAVDTFGDLKDTVAAPSPGCYTKDAVTGAYTNVSLYEGDNCELNVPFGVGRYPHTQFGEFLGYNYYQHPLWFGSFWEKLGALFTLADSTAYFADLYVGEQLNIGVGTSLGYNTVFAEDMNNFLGGIISGDMDFYAGREVQGTYVEPSVPGRKVCETPDQADCDANVEPSLNNFTLKLYASVLGLAYLPAGFDPQFIDRVAVFVEGEATQFDHTAAGINRYECVDQIGGKTYVAYSTNYGYYGEPKVEAGVNLVRRCQQYMDAWEAADSLEDKQQWAVRLQNVRETMDVLRNLHQIYGTSVLGF